MHRVVATLILLGAFGVDAVAAQEACVQAPNGGTVCGKLMQPETAQPAWPSPSQGPSPSQPSPSQPNFSQPSLSQPSFPPPAPSQAASVASGKTFDGAVRRSVRPNKPRRIASHDLQRGNGRQAERLDERRYGDRDRFRDPPRIAQGGPDNCNQDPRWARIEERRYDGRVRDGGRVEERRYDNRDQDRRLARIDERP